jgi:hypothetical protein
MGKRIHEGVEEDNDPFLHMSRVARLRRREQESHKKQIMVQNGDAYQLVSLMEGLQSTRKADSPIANDDALMWRKCPTGTSNVFRQRPQTRHREPREEAKTQVRDFSER